MGKRGCGAVRLRENGSKRSKATFVTVHMQTHTIEMRSYLAGRRLLEQITERKKSQEESKKAK